MRDFSDDIAKAKAGLTSLPCDWDGKRCVLELKAADYNWRQMEWRAFYFEFLCRSRLKATFQIPGDRMGAASFDLKDSVNWDMKAKAIKSDKHDCILNDCAATDASIAAHGCHGVIIALCDVQYNDEDRSFQRWHSEHKGGLSKYEQERRQRTSVSRYRKTHAMLTEVLFLRLDGETVKHLGQMAQGRNANGKPRPPKYLVNLEDLDDLFIDRIEFLK